MTILGKHIIIVGRCGSGKTTLLNSILKFCKFQRVLSFGKRDTNDLNEINEINETNLIYTPTNVSGIINYLQAVKPTESHCLVFEDASITHEFCTTIRPLVQTDVASCIIISQKLPLIPPDLMSKFHIYAFWSVNDQLLEYTRNPTHLIFDMDTYTAVKLYPHYPNEPYLMTKSVLELTDKNNIKFILYEPLNVESDTVQSDTEVVDMVNDNEVVDIEEDIEEDIENIVNVDIEDEVDNLKKELQEELDKIDVEQSRQESTTPVNADFVGDTHAPAKATILDELNSIATQFLPAPKELDLHEEDNIISTKFSPNNYKICDGIESNSEWDTLRGKRVDYNPYLVFDGSSYKPRNSSISSYATLGSLNGSTYSIEQYFEYLGKQVTKVYENLIKQEDLDNLVRTIVSDRIKEIGKTLVQQLVDKMVQNTVETLVKQVLDNKVQDLAEQMKRETTTVEVENMVKDILETNCISDNLNVQLKTRLDNDFKSFDLSERIPDSKRF